ncbi:MAG: type I restriction enzyme HsdR N-terminal domain-containing protein [Saprospiraceae bacterium]|nr:type I restriction enzyme HsdR N-terminal domain-containing protein [Saprospiraceae bacterium]
MIIECKSPDIQLDHKVVSQVVRYNRALGAPYLCITNGLVHQFSIKTIMAFGGKLTK